VEDARAHRDLVPQFATQAIQRIVERIFFIDVVSFDWNCPKYITPRYTAAEVETAVAPLRRRISELEAELAAGTKGATGCDQPGPEQPIANRRMAVSKD
jgi:hypothetical protein